MPPAWLTVLAWISLAAGVASAVAVLLDIYLSGRRQRMRVMEVVWPLTALYLGPLGWPAYARFGRVKLTGGDEAGEEDVPEWEGALVSATHCGAGCALGDVFGEWIVFAGALTIGGVTLWPEYIFDFAIAYVLGILFQYAAIKPMSDSSRREALFQAVRADSLSLIAFQVGMFGWMAISHFVLFADPHLTADQAAFWLMMQIGMALGLATTYPVNVWLVRRGVKHAMGRPVLRRARPVPA
jgi:hypothetical protein